MTRKLTDWPFEIGQSDKSGRQLAAEGMPFPWRQNQSMKSANLVHIWEKSVQTFWWQ